ncbi:hypothetical protein ElyMa_001890400 [Elysia marginata]|uniref:Uncharacterized protein n=1 Tax=Elysia marginata TaxID=1093978 RepID=A0AAV4EQH9_9GAST|nr:hypothetical protein ElyMa_001890400 [Elysia marginata]
MSPDLTAFPRQFSWAQWKASADEDDKRRLGVITSRNGPEWQCTNWSGQPQTELLLPSDPPNDPTGRGTDYLCQPEASSLSQAYRSNAPAD